MAKYYGAILSGDSPYIMHYGRKGMKRGMSIFGDGTYKPIGQKAGYGTTVTIGKDNVLARGVQAANAAGNRINQFVDNAKQTYSDTKSAIGRGASAAGQMVSGAANAAKENLKRDARQGVSNAVSSVKNSANTAAQKAMFAGAKSESEIRRRAALIGAASQSAKDYQNRKSKEDTSVKITSKPMTEAEWRRQDAMAGMLRDARNQNATRKNADAQLKAAQDRRVNTLRSQEKSNTMNEARQLKQQRAKDSAVSAQRNKRMAEYQKGMQSAANAVKQGKQRAAARSIDVKGAFESALKKHQTALGRQTIRSDSTIDSAKAKRMVAGTYAKAAADTAKQTGNALKLRAGDAASKVGRQAKSASRSIGKQVGAAADSAKQAASNAANEVMDFVNKKRKKKG